MWSSLLLALISICCGKLCTIKSVKQLEQASDCTVMLAEFKDKKLAQHPLLAEKLKTVNEVRRLSLYNTMLRSLTDSPNMTLGPNAVLEMVDNEFLEHLPKFIIEDGSSVELKIRGNPRMNTNQLRDECYKKKCSPNAIANIQESFTCPLEKPIRKVCKVISDNIDLTEYESALDKVEVVVGTLKLKGSNVTSFPKMKSLILLKQAKKSPVLIIEDNPNLNSLKALYTLEIQLNKGESADNAINIGNNPKLCIDEDASTVPFVIKYLSRVPICEPKEINEANKSSLAIIILYFIITNI
ncbi:hypothetical protein GCK32_000714 [Trichostrongylus colubriformis]|uniref:Receptor L-domain domain-containing protein n=1 Tax=Trichostrongylus colubriformis TaxID=6319 RepID=A0AAN8IJ86_TRICO